MTTMSDRSPGVPEWDLVDRLSKAMRVRGLTNATEMAELLGMHRNSVQDYLRGKRSPDRRTMMAWAMSCGVSYEWLETGSVSGDPNGGLPGPIPFQKRATRSRGSRTDVGPLQPHSTRGDGGPFSLPRVA